MQKAAVIARYSTTFKCALILFLFYMMVSLSVIDFLMLALALQCLVLAGLLAFFSKKIGSNRWLAAFILVITQIVVSWLLFSSSLGWQYPMLTPVVPILKMAVGPLIYFYTRSLVQGDKKLRPKEYLHFLPLLLNAQPQLISLFYVSGILSIPAVTHIYFSPAAQGFMFHDNALFNLPTLASMVIYLWLSYRLTNNTLNNTQPSAHKLTDLKWLNTFFYLVFALIVVFTVAILASFLSGWNNYFLMVPLIVFVYWLGMVTFVRQSKMSATEVVEYNKPPVKIHFTTAEADQYQLQITALMERDKAYLNPALKLDAVAAQLGISERLVSSLLNQHVGKNFNDFVNDYRVSEAKTRLTDPALKQFTIAAIAADCGFNSLATFQRCFKQVTGITPSQYQNGIKEGLVPVATTPLNTGQQ